MPSDIRAALCSRSYEKAGDRAKVRRLILGLNFRVILEECEYQKAGHILNTFSFLSIVSFCAKSR
jgi:hypothetical protein